MPENFRYISSALHTPSLNQLSPPQQHKPPLELNLKRRERRKRGAMEYGHPCNNSSSNKEKRPPLKRGQLKVQIAKTLGSLVVPGARNSFRR